MEKQELIERWRDILGQHYRAGNATCFTVCLRQIWRLRTIM